MACASAWLAAAAARTSQEAFAPRPALPPTRVWSLRRGARGPRAAAAALPGRSPAGPRDVPPSHDSRSLTLEPGSSSANSSSSSSSRRRAGMARAPSRLPAQPAGSGGRCGRAEDGAGAPRGQRGGGWSSAKEELSRRRRHPHSRPFKRRLGASSGRGGAGLGAGPRLGGATAGQGQARVWAGLTRWAGPRSAQAAGRPRSRGWRGWTAPAQASASRGAGLSRLGAYPGAGGGRQPRHAGAPPLGGRRCRSSLRETP